MFAVFLLLLGTHCSSSDDDVDDDDSNERGQIRVHECHEEAQSFDRWIDAGSIHWVVPVDSFF